MKYLLLSLTLLIAFITLFIIGLNIGSFNTSYDDVLSSLINFDSNNMIHVSIVKLRMSRIIMAFLVGGCLALSGYLMQLLVNNPLGDPYILGTSSAASLGVNIVHFLPLGLISSSLYFSSLFGFGFAILATMVVVIIAQKRGILFPSRMLLAGIAMSSLMTALISMLTFMSDEEGKLRSIVFWIMGSFEMASWDKNTMLCILLFISTLVFVFFRKELNMMLLGSNRATELGFNEKKFRWIIIVFASVLAAVTVTVAGPIGFVGLIIPHFTRALFGSTSRYNILFVVLIGGVFMMACDVLSKVLYMPGGLPIGIVTSFFGVPFFVYLLLKENFTFD